MTEHHPGPHDKRHDGVCQNGTADADNRLPSYELPLKDSNLHSSDPESGQRDATLDAVGVSSGQKAPESDTTHTLGHTVKHTVAGAASAVPPPPAARGGLR